MTVVDLVFFLQIIALIMAGLITTRGRNFLGVSICLLYIATSTSNYIWANPKINAIFSTPLVFLVSWLVIKHSKVKLITINKADKDLQSIKETNQAILGIAQNKARIDADEKANPTPQHIGKQLVDQQIIKTKK